ncbi:hypothetical protein B0H14DRAFT_2557518 [Mycena olivaceomarginata]|nr:hypothetical protein B0H14DRAFT_2557518 [Mycena olivaceomarginata]
MARLRFSVDSFSEVVHAICLGHALYALIISDYGQLEHSVVASRSLPAVIFLSGIVAASVEAFFAFRIYALSKKLYIPIFSWIMSGLCVVGVSVIFAVLVEKISRDLTRSRGLLVALWSVAAINDLTVTKLFWLFHKKLTLLSRTVALMDKLIMYTIESGMLISASSIATLTCLVSMKDNFISNSLLARATFRAMNQVSSSSSIPTIQKCIVYFSSFDSPATVELVPSKPGLATEPKVPNETHIFPEGERGLCAKHLEPSRLRLGQLKPEESSLWFIRGLSARTSSRMAWVRIEHRTQQVRIPRRAKIHRSALHWPEECGEKDGTSLHPSGDSLELKPGINSHSKIL